MSWCSLCSPHLSYLTFPPLCLPSSTWLLEKWVDCLRLNVRIRLWDCRSIWLNFCLRHFIFSKIDRKQQAFFVWTVLIRSYCFSALKLQLLTSHVVKKVHTVSEMQGYFAMFFISEPHSGPVNQVAHFILILSSHQLLYIRRRLLCRLWVYWPKLFKLLNNNKNCV